MEAPMPAQQRDPEDFVVPGRDLNDRSVRISLEIPSLLNQAVNDAFNSGKFPFQTKDGVFRWCLYHGVKTLESTEHFSGLLPILDVMVLVMQMRWRARTCESFFEKLDKVVLQLLASEFQEQRVRKLLESIRELIICMPSSRDRGLYLSELRQRWGHLLTPPAERITEAGKRFRDEL